MFDKIAQDLENSETVYLTALRQHKNNKNKETLRQLKAAKEVLESVKQAAHIALYGDMSFSY